MHAASASANPIVASACIDRWILLTPPALRVRERVANPQGVKGFEERGLSCVVLADQDGQWLERHIDRAKTLEILQLDAT